MREETSNYNIYFDESNKIDSPAKEQYSYYGAFGVSNTNQKLIEKEIEEIFSELNTKSELHFNRYKAGSLSKYFRVIDSLLSKEISINIFMLNNKDYKDLGKVLNQDINTLKKYFYVKIPERLFYGIVRNQNQIKNIDVFMDESTEYETLNVYEKIEEQMNAHSLYRHKEYKVLKVEGMSSENSLMIQCVDVIMGVIVFLLQKKYKDKSKADKAKSDLIFRVLSEKNNFEKLKDIVTVFIWNSEVSIIKEYHINDALNDFFMFMNKEDFKNMGMVQKAYINVIEGKELEYEEKKKKLKDCLKCSSAELYQYLGYLSEIEEEDRNIKIRRTY